MVNTYTAYYSWDYPLVYKYQVQLSILRNFLGIMDFFYKNRDLCTIASYNLWTNCRWEWSPASFFRYMVYSRKYWIREIGAYYVRT